ncbi:MAG: energy-coupling factor transporter transmembrane protein EcfT [Desulfobacterales bacterium]|nr:energy-coupling factor transporter transmembrane protein EcfT [Desulfobacterales bacterium]
MPVLSVNNPVARLDIRTRMLICLVCSVGIIFIQSYGALIVMTLASLGYALAHGRLKVLAVAWCGVGVMFGMAMACVQIMVVFWPGLGESGLSTFINPFLRVLILVNTILALAVSSRIQDIMASLKSFGLPFFIYLPTAVMVRFIPEFINDVKLIRESMQIKGFRPGLGFVTFHPFLVIRLLVVPLTIRALRSADTLSVAAELKGMDSAVRMTRISPNRPNVWDITAAVSVLLLTSGSIIAEGFL